MCRSSACRIAWRTSRSSDPRIADKPSTLLLCSPLPAFRVSIVPLECSSRRRRARVFRSDARCDCVDAIPLSLSLSLPRSLSSPRGIQNLNMRNCRRAHHACAPVIFYPGSGYTGTPVLSHDSCHIIDSSFLFVVRARWERLHLSRITTHYHPSRFGVPERETPASSIVWSHLRNRSAADSRRLFVRNE